jgi:predicted nucleic acid-binding protein
MNASQIAVVDAGLAIFTVLNTPQSEAAARVWENLLRDRIRLHAPCLWRYEVTSVIRKYLIDGLLTPDEAERALETALALSVNFAEEDDALCRSALRWADQLGQRAAYDGFYLALAERLAAPLWTSDKRLANNAKKIGANWVRWMGDESDMAA